MFAAIRVATPDDEPFLERLLAQTKATEFAYLPPELAPTLVAQQRLAQRAALAAGGGEQIALNREGQPIARLVVQGRAGALHLVDLTVDAAVHRQGIGAALVALVIAQAEAAEQDVTLHVDPANAPALGLYARAGFVAENRNELAIEMRRPRTAV